MEAYPENVLPLPMLEPFTMDQLDTVVRTPLVSGRSYERKRFTKEYRQLQAKWELKEDKFKIFQSWIYWKINSGADFFTMYMRLGGGNVGSGDLQNYTCRFIDRYKASIIGTNWNVTALLEVEDLQLMTLTQLNAAIA